VNEAASLELARTVPGLVIAGRQHGYFQDSAAVVEHINEAERTCFLWRWVATPGILDQRTHAHSENKLLYGRRWQPGCSERRDQARSGLLPENRYRVAIPANLRAEPSPTPGGTALFTLDI